MANEAPEKELPEDIIHACPDYIIVTQEGDTRSHIIRTQKITTMHYQPKKDAEGIINIFFKTDYGYMFDTDCTESQLDCFIKKVIPKFAGLNFVNGLVIY